MAQRPSSRHVVTVKRMQRCRTTPKSVSVILPDRFYQWHLCHCWDFVAVFWIRELRAGRADFNYAMVPYAIKVCLSWLLGSDVTLKNNRIVRTLLGTHFGCYPASMRAQMMMELMSVRPFPELRGGRASLP